MWREKKELGSVLLYFLSSSSPGSIIVLLDQCDWQPQEPYERLTVKKMNISQAGLCLALPGNKAEKVSHTEDTPYYWF